MPGHGHIRTGDIVHGIMTRGTTADGTTLGTMDMQDIGDGIRGSTCILIMPDGTAVGMIRIGGIITIILIRGTVTDLTIITDLTSIPAHVTAQDLTGYSPQAHP